MRVTRWLLPLLAALALPALGADDYFPDAHSARECEGGMGYSNSCVLAKTGTASAEVYAKRGDNLVRLMAWDAFNKPRLVLSFSLDAQGRAQLRIADVIGGGHALALPLRERDWRAATKALRQYQVEAQNPPSLKPSPNAPGIRAVCVSFDSWSEMVESAQAGRVERVRRGDALSVDNCFDPIDDLAIRLRAIALGVVPQCDALALAGSEEKLERCAMLFGDRARAVALYNRAATFDSYYCPVKDKDSDFEPLFDPQVRFAMDGAAPVQGPSAVAQAWRVLLCKQGYDLQVTSVEGTPDGGVVYGRMMKVRQVPAHDNQVARYFHRDADFVQHWTRGPGGRLRMTDWVIGALGAEIEVLRD